MSVRHTFLAIAALALIAAPALAQETTIAEGEAAGIIGEQADGFIGVRLGQTASPDLRARVDQINIRRRAEYTTRAQRANATPNEMAASVVCVLFSTRLSNGEWYRDEAGTWRQVTAATPVAMPSWCP